MTAHTAALSARARARSLVGTGGPGEGSSWLEHVLGWILVVVVAMLVTRLGWF